MMKPIYNNLSRGNRPLNGALWQALLLAGVLCVLSLPVLAIDSPPPAAGTTSTKPGDDAKPADVAKAAPEPPYADDDEVKLGKKNAEQNDKSVKLITDPAITDRVNRIGQELAAIANKDFVKPLWGYPTVKRFHYTFKVVDDKDVNAYSLPGGFIYVNKGLLDYVRSDDELAGVLGHEITHASHHHMMRLLKEQKKINNVMLPALAAAILAGKGGMESAGQLIIASQLYMIARINSYGVDAEKDADNGGLELMTKSHYNPVGLYSFMLRLARDEEHHPVGELGIYRTHPPSPERATSAREHLDKLKIPIRLSDVDPTLQPTIKLISEANSPQQAEIAIRGYVLCRVVAADGMTPEQRAQKIAKKIRNLIDLNLQPYEIKVNKTQGTVVARSTALFISADASAQKKSLDDMARQLSDAISQLSIQSQLDTTFSN